MGADAAIAFAEAQLGKPYKIDTAGPDTYDCSGLVMEACKAGGVTIGRTTFDQITDGSRVGRADLLPGDLVFPEPTHVQLYIGNGQVIEAPHTGAFVRYNNLGAFMTGRRVFPDGSSNQPGGVTGVTNVTPVTSVGDALSSISGAVAFLTQSSFWKRAGLFVLAGVIILVALSFLRGRSSPGQSSSIETAAKVGALL